MGILIVGLAFMAGLFVADRLMTQDCDAALANLPGPRAKAAGAAATAGAGGPKAGPGDVVACLPCARWGRVRAVSVGGDGGWRYAVGLEGGGEVELTGREIAR